MFKFVTVHYLDNAYNRRFLRASSSVKAVDFLISLGGCLGAVFRANLGYRTLLFSSSLITISILLLAHSHLSIIIIIIRYRLLPFLLDNF